MSAGMTQDASIAPDVFGGDTSARDWFLRDSKWEDVRWTFAPTNLLEEEQPARILWDFRLPSGRRFTDPEYDSLRETCKRLIASVRARSLSTGLPQRARTAIGHFAHLRPLLHWMDKEGYRRFAEIDCDAILRFRHAIGERRGRGGAYVLPNTLTSLLEALASLYHLRDELGDGLLVDPFLGRSPRQLAGAYGVKHYGPYTPDAIAIPLVQQSIEFLEHGAIDVLRAREIYATTMAQTLERISSNGNCNRSVLEALGALSINTPRGPQRIFRIQDLNDVIDMLYAACFVVISYLVGARVSEILHLRAGCIQPRPTLGVSGATEIEVMTGTIFKHDRGYFGRPHEWVVPQVAIHAVSVLEALSAPNRERAGRSELWLRARTAARTMGATEWQREPPGPSAVRVITPSTMTECLQRYARWLNLPSFEGKSRRLTAREARKTFARFAALRDRTCLYALAQHLGHRDRSVTDSGYSGTDHDLEREIRTEVLERSVAAWEHMLSTPQLGGRAGHEILAKRPVFRGARMKVELKSYARTLVEAGLVLGVCDYGYCVYRQEYSACRGNSAGPNPVHREPSTCARCLNFAVSTSHRPYWLDQSKRCEALLNEPALPTQTLKIARERLEEARAVLASIDKSVKDGAHAHQASA
jgi:integrase